MRHGTPLQARYRAGFLVSDGLRAGPAGAPPGPNGDIRWRRIDLRMERLEYRPECLREVLQLTQDIFGFLDEQAMSYLAERFRVPPGKVHSVARFYSFIIKPQSLHTCVICTGVACQVNGAAILLAEMTGALGVKVGETTSDGKVSVLKARCLGVCDVAPVALVDGELRERVELAGLLALLPDRLAACP